MLNMNPHKKLEIIEKCIAVNQKSNMPEQYDSFNEKTKLIETSLKYTKGDMEKAKAMHPASIWMWWWSR
jgi:hypothetical protein